MKAIEQYFHVVLVITLYKVVQTFKSVEEKLKCDLQIKATEQTEKCFPVDIIVRFVISHSLITGKGLLVRCSIRRRFLMNNR